jgi:hypothetical protein
MTHTENLPSNITSVILRTIRFSDGFADSDISVEFQGGQAGINELTKIATDFLREFPHVPTILPVHSIFNREAGIHTAEHVQKGVYLSIVLDLAHGFMVTTESRALCPLIVTQYTLSYA